MKYLKKLAIPMFYLALITSLNCSKNSTSHSNLAKDLLGIWMISYQVWGEETIEDNSGFMIIYKSDSTWQSNQTAFHYTSNGFWSVTGDTIIHRDDYSNYPYDTYTSPFVYYVDDTSLVWNDFEEAVNKEYHFRRFNIWQ